MKTFQYFLLGSLMLTSPVYALDSDTINKNNGTENKQVSQDNASENSTNKTKKSEQTIKKTKKHNVHKNIYKNHIARQPHRENTKH